jgi:mono/diheme cytochrome c family protein
MKAVRWLLRMIAYALALLVFVTLVLMIQGRGLATRHIDRVLPKLVVAPDASLIERGRHLSRVKCASCHAPDLSQPDALSGGAENFFAIPGGPTFGVLYAPNITNGGSLRTTSDGQLSRALREGISARGTPLLVMPSPNMHTLSDRDLAALIAFMRAQPAIEHELPARRINPLGYFILGLHKFEDSVMGSVIKPIADVPEDSTSAYGEYLATYLGCGDCHGAALRGGVKGQLPPLGPDLVSLVQRKPYETFELALRHGVHESGRAMDSQQMPWATLSRLTDLEVRAVYEYIKTAPAPPP